MDPFQKYSPGDAWEPNAQWLNAVTDSLKRDLARTVLQAAVKPLALPRNDALYLGNVSGQALNQFAVVGLGAMPNTPALNLQAWSNRILFHSAAPAVGAPFGILQEPIGDGPHYGAVASSTGQNPYEAAATYWQIFVGAVAAWSALTAYVAGNRVTSGGNTYVCILAHTNQTPPNGTYWQLLGTDQGAWNSLTAYVAGDQTLVPRIGQMYLAGVSRVRVRMMHPTHKYAGPVAGVYDHLDSQANCGPCRILWNEGGPGADQWAVVLFIWPCQDAAGLAIPTGAFVLLGYPPKITCRLAGPYGTIRLVGYGPSVYGLVPVIVPPTGLLRLIGYAPTAYTTPPGPPTGKIRLVGYAPKSVVQKVVPPTGLLRLVGYQVSIYGPGPIIVPPTGKIRLVGYTPSVYGSVPVIVPPRGTIRLVGYGPSKIGTLTFIYPPRGTIRLVGYGPSITSDGNPHGSQTFTSSGNFTVPAGVTTLTKVECWGQGGAGGGRGDTGSYGGGGGGYAKKNTVTVSPGDVMPVTINGAASTFKTVGGVSTIASANAGTDPTLSPGVGGSGTVGDVLNVGGNGGDLGATTGGGGGGSGGSAGAGGDGVAGNSGGAGGAAGAGGGAAGGAGGTSGNPGTAGAAPGGGGGGDGANNAATVNGGTGQVKITW